MSLFCLGLLSGALNVLNTKLGDIADDWDMEKS